MLLSRRVKSLMAVLILAFLWIIAGDIHGAARRPYGGTLKLPMVEKIATTDPAKVETWAETELSRQLHETLYRIRSDGTVQPALAQEMPKISNGGKEWIVNLRPQAKFHDGRNVTVNDIIASWERLLRPQTMSPHWWLLAPIQGAMSFRRGVTTKISGLEGVNKLTLRIRLEVPISNFIQVLAAVPTASLPVSTLSSHPGEESNPVGCGPFFWATTRENGEEFGFEAFKEHVLGRPYLDRLSFIAYPSSKASSLAFELGEVHSTLGHPSRRSGEYQEIDGPEVWMVYLALNPQRIALLPNGFLQAVTRAVDRQALVEYLVAERGTATDEILSLESKELSQSPLRGDPKAARDFFQLILTERKIPPVLLFLVHEDQALERAIAERIQVNLIDIGVVVSLLEVNSEQFKTRLAEGSYDFFVARPIPLVRDPELQLMGILAQLQKETGVEELIQSYKNISMDENRSAVVREMARRYQVKLPWIPLFQQSLHFILQTNVREYSQESTGLTNFAEIWLAN